MKRSRKVAPSRQGRPETPRALGIRGNPGSKATRVTQSMWPPEGGNNHFSLRHSKFGVRYSIFSCFPVPPVSRRGTACRAQGVGPMTSGRKVAKSKGSQSRMWPPEGGILNTSLRYPLFPISLVFRFSTPRARHAVPLQVNNTQTRCARVYASCALPATLPTRGGGQGEGVMSWAVLPYPATPIVSIRRSFVGARHAMPLAWGL